jgi:Acyl-CoA dehydrogenase N terminal
MSYTAPVRDIAFMMRHVAGLAPFSKKRANLQKRVLHR